MSCHFSEGFFQTVRSRDTNPRPSGREPKYRNFKCPFGSRNLKENIVQSTWWRFIKNWTFNQGPDFSNNLARRQSSYTHLSPSTWIDIGKVEPGIVLSFQAFVANKICVLRSIKTRDEKTIKINFLEKNEKGFFIWKVVAFCQIRKYWETFLLKIIKTVLDDDRLSGFSLPQKLSNGFKASVSI